MQATKSLLDKKLVEPSILITLQSAANICEALESLLNEASVAVAQHNDIISHRSEQKRQIIADLWLYAAIAAKSRIGAFDVSRLKAQSKIDGLKKSIEGLDKSIHTAEKELDAAERSKTNVRETADAINALLLKFGFTNFKLAVTDDGKYRIVRLDGAGTAWTSSNTGYAHFRIGTASTPEYITAARNQCEGR
ncbi:AAA family ATPase [Adlercreutzia sp. ZJ304]|uniref:AAA family ATPase n=1 Tax=Adlercreutzia sp. ZJ304 TaxID=2709791 RepID=UPI0013EB7F9F|nr:AAA family ATPase [Adlercreutzia sp. ZJ304]